MKLASPSDTELAQAIEASQALLLRQVLAAERSAEALETIAALIAGFGDSSDAIKELRGTMDFHLDRVGR